MTKRFATIAAIALLATTVPVSAQGFGYGRGATGFTVPPYTPPPGFVPDQQAYGGDP